MSGGIYDPPTEEPLPLYELSDGAGERELEDAHDAYCQMLQAMTQEQLVAEAAELSQRLTHVEAARAEIKRENVRLVDIIERAVQQLEEYEDDEETRRLKGRHVSEDTRKAIVILAEMDWPHTRIAKVLGVGRPTVRKHALRAEAQA